MVILALGILLITMMMGVAVPFAFTLCIVILLFMGGYDPAFLVPYGITKVATSTLLAIPLFIMAGGLMSRGRSVTRSSALLIYFSVMLKEALLWWPLVPVHFSARSPAALALRYLA